MWPSVVQVHDGTLYVNGVPRQEPFTYEKPRYVLGKLVVPPGDVSGGWGVLRGKPEVQVPPSAPTHDVLRGGGGSWSIGAVGVHEGAMESALKVSTSPLLVRHWGWWYMR